MPLRPDSTPTHLGCFHENVYQPDLSGEPPTLIAQAEACFKHCSFGAWSYAAIRNRTVCTCGDSYNKYGFASDSECSTACPEESSVFDHCGGPEANSVYSIGSIVTKAPLSTPSVGGYPTPPNPLPSNGGVIDPHDHGHHTSTAVVVVSSVVVAVVMLGMMLMFVHRKRHNESQSNKDGPKGSDHGLTSARRGSGGEGIRGGTMGGRRTLRRDSSGNTTRVGGTTWTSPDKQQQEAVEKDIEAQLFAGFESCAPDEEPRQIPAQIVVSPLVTSPSSSNSTDSTAATSITNQPSYSQLYPVSIDNANDNSGQQARFPSIVSKIGEKFSQLRVKTQYLQPPLPTHKHHHHTHNNFTSSPPSPSTCPSLSLTPSPTTPSSQYPPPVSPISPISPGFLLSPPGAHHSKIINDEDEGEGDTDRHDPGNKTLSFSTISAPVPGPAANNNNHGRKHKRSSTHSYQFQPWHTAAAPVTEYSSLPCPPQSPQAKAQADKEHRSKLIQDLILHGD